MKKQNIYNRVALAILLAVEIILFLSPFGYIRIGIFNITTLHLPVLIAALALGWKAGMIAGLFFGCISIWNATFFPNVTSFVFSPFIEVGGVHGNFTSLIIALVPRMLLGISCAFFFQIFSKHLRQTKWNLLLASALATLIHTILVFFFIYIFFANAYANATQIPSQALVASFLGIFLTNGIAEIIVACIISMYIYPLLQHIKKRIL